MRLPMRGPKVVLLASALALAASGEAQAALGLQHAGASLSREARGKTLLARAKKRKRRAPSADADAKPEAPADSSASDDDEAGAKSSPAEVADTPPPKAERARSSTAEEGGDDSEASGGKISKSRKSKIVMEEPAESPERGALAPALELGVGGMALFRQLAWTSDARAAGLGPYSLTPGPEAGVWLEFYPAAFATGGFAANIGLVARYDYGFGVTSRTASGGDVGTKYQDFLAGLKLRIPLGTFTPHLAVELGEQGFRLTAEGTPQDLPAMDYSFVRIGAGTRVQFTPEVALDVSGAFLAVTNPGSGAGQVASASYFPNTKAYAVDFGASVAMHVTGSIGARAGLDLRQYGLAFHPAAGDARIVSGAVNRYIVAFAGLEVVLDGRGAAAGDADDDEGAAEPAPPSSKRKHRAKDDEDDDSNKDAESSDDDS